MGLLPISETLLRPKQDLPFELAKQSYLKYGPLEFEESDISSERALVAVEHDRGFLRVDGLGSLQQVKEKLATGEGLLNSYQLADSFMKGMAFKLDKL